MFAIISDVALLVIFAVTLITCYKKGLIASVARLLSLIGGIIFARMFSFVLEGVLYRRVFESLLNDTVQATLEKAVAGLETGASAAMDALLSAANELTASFPMLGLTQPGLELPAEITDTVALTESLAGNIAEPIAMWISGLCAYIILFFIGYIVLRFVFSLLNLLAKLPILNSVNRVLGALIGVVLASLYTFIGAQVLRFVYGILLANGTLSASDGLGYILTWLP